MAGDGDESGLILTRADLYAILSREGFNLRIWEIRKLTFRQMYELYLRTLARDEAEEQKELADYTEAEFDDWIAAARDFVGEKPNVDEWQRKAKAEWAAARAEKHGGDR